jgi:hypothetical protein
VFTLEINGLADAKAAIFAISGGPGIKKPAKKAEVMQNHDDDFRRLPPATRRRWLRQQRRLAEVAQPPSPIDDDDDNEFAEAHRDRPVQRRYVEDFDDDPEPEADELLAVLEYIDYQRHRLNRYGAALKSLLQRYPDLQAKWRQFTGAGGLSAEDFKLFLRGQWRPKIIRQRRHLRLVVNQRHKPTVIRSGNDPEAA